jgi:uncharacterized protein YcfJ
MRKYLHLWVIFVFSIVLTGCATNRTRVGEGAALGGLIGATAGGVVGHQSGHGVGGALGAGAVGAAVGGLIGSQMNKPETITRDTTTTATTTAVTPSSSNIGVQQVVDWTKQGLTSDEIISRINGSSTSFYLTSDDIRYLRREGVSERVIETMQNR